MAENEPPPQSEKSVVPQGVKKNLGPLPIWVWVVGIAGAIGLGLYIRSRGSSPGTSTVAGIPTGGGATSDNGTVNPDPLSLAANSSANDPMSHADLLSAVSSLVAQASGNRATNPLGVGSGVSSILGRTSSVPTGGIQINPGVAAVSTTHTSGGTDTQRVAAPPPTPAPYIPPISQVKIVVPPKVTPPPSWVPPWLVQPAAKPTILSTPYVSAPALNQNNPVSDYGRGN